MSGFKYCPYLLLAGKTPTGQAPPPTHAIGRACVIMYSTVVLLSFVLS